MQKYIDICAQNNKAQTHPFSKMTEADEAFKQLIIECGRALNTLELVILNLRFPLLQYFETLSIYKLPKVEKFMVFTLRKALSPADFSIMEEYDSFKGQHGQTEAQKLIAKMAINITAKLTRWYIKIGNAMWPPEFITAPAAFTSAAPAAPLPPVPFSGNTISIY